MAEEAVLLAVGAELVGVEAVHALNHRIFDSNSIDHKYSSALSHLVAGVVPMPPVFLVQPLLGLTVRIEAVRRLATDIVLREEVAMCYASLAGLGKILLKCI